MARARALAGAAVLGLALAGGCASGPIEGEAASGIALVTSAKDAPSACAAANEALDGMAPRALLERILARSRRPMADKAFEGAAAADPAVKEEHPWQRDEWWVFTKLIPHEGGAWERRLFFGKMDQRLAQYCELAIALRPLAAEGGVGVGAEVHVLYAFPREGKERTWGIKFWRAAFQEARDAVRVALGKLGAVKETGPPIGRERD